MFKQIDSVPNLPAQEKEINTYWKNIKVVDALKKQRKDRKSPEKVYYDGPITANGMPHYGHAITWTLKDVVPRYWSMMGNLVDRSMGWDTKGILVEYEVEKALGFKSKADIKTYGEAEFIQKCRDFVQGNQSIIFEYEDRVGRWFDPSIIYSTADSKYVESIWWALAELYKKGILYEGHKTVPYSTRAGCTLSSHEVSEGGYKEIEDPFVTVKFKKIGEQNTYFLAWTTTPWTIPGNLMLAANKDLTYVKVESVGTTYICAKDRVDALFGGREYKIIEEFLGSTMEGQTYEPVLPYFANKKEEGCFKVIMSGHANAEDGTGIVHLAPYGEEDYALFMGLGIRLFDYLDELANFTSLVPEFEGLFYKQANPKIIEKLTQLDALFETGTIVHRMPMCYRTGTPLIYKPVKSWYVATSKIKSRMLEENQRIHWSPEHLKNGRSGMWIQGARDWAISRTRYWGTPIPVWVNDKTQEKVFVGSYEQLEKLAGKPVTEPHRPDIDTFTWEDPVNGGTFRRIPDVLDVWFDSGCMPFAHIHYPFENTERFKEIMPASYISEGPDQIRLWFYVMHVIGVGLFDKIPYDNVVTIGTMLNEEGKKMSKSKKNYKPMDESLDQYGADVLRYFILTSPILMGEDTNFGEKFLDEARKEFFLPLWNSLKYFLTYADMYNFKPVLGKPTVKLDGITESEFQLDNWILARVQELNNKVIGHMEKYEIMLAARQFGGFVSDLSTWYIRRSRDRIKNGDMQAIGVLYYVLAELSKLMAPFFPFLSEEIYLLLGMRDLSGSPSVHMDLYSSVEVLTPEQEELLTTMKTTRELVSLALSVRVAEGVKVRQPLRSVSVLAKKEGDYKFFEGLILDEVNVKSAVLVAADLAGETIKFAETDNAKVFLDTALDAELQLEGSFREVVRKVQDLRKEQKLNVTDKVKVWLPTDETHKKVVEAFGEDLKQKVLSVEVVLGDAYKVEKV